VATAAVRFICDDTGPGVRPAGFVASAQGCPRLNAEAERVLHRIYQPTRLQGGGCDCPERNADLADALDALARGVEARAFRTPKRTRSIGEAMRHSAKKLGATLLMLRSPIKRIRRALELNLVMATMPFIGIGCIPQQFVPMLLEMGVATGRHRKYDTAISRETLLIDLSCNVVYVIGSLITCVLLVVRCRCRRALQRVRDSPVPPRPAGQDWATHAAVHLPVRQLGGLCAGRSDAARAIHAPHRVAEAHAAVRRADWSHDGLRQPRHGRGAAAPGGGL
jgi:hypothetical protein